MVPYAPVNDTLRHGPVALSELEQVGQDLQRPECVLAHADGDLFVPDWRGGVTRVKADGSQETWLAVSTNDIRPNGIAMLPGGSFLLANLGVAGGVWRLHRDGTLVPFVTEMRARLLPADELRDRGPTRSYVDLGQHAARAAAGRLWRPDIADGFIVLVDDMGARVVADGLHYTNEVRPDPSGQWLYIVETFGRRLVRYSLGGDGGLSGRETVVTFGPSMLSGWIRVRPGGRGSRSRA